MSNERKPLNGLGISVPGDERTRRLLWASEAMLLLLLAVCLSGGGGPVLAELCLAAMAPAVVGH